MPDMIPAHKITAKAYDHALKAKEALTGLSSSYSSEQRQIDAAKASLAACLELMSLVVPEPEAERVNIRVEEAQSFPVNAVIVARHAEDNQ